MYTSKTQNDWYLELLRLAGDEFGHDPIKPHLSNFNLSDGIPVLNGSSKFEVCTSNMGAVGLIDQICFDEATNLVRIEPGSNGAIIHIFKAGEPIGWSSDSKPIRGKKYFIAEDHGCRQAFTTNKEDVDILEAETDIITFVISPEFKKRFMYVMASIHPGYPDPISNWEGLKVGDIVSGEELFERNIVRVKVKTN